MTKESVNLDNIIEMYCQNEFHDGSIHFHKENLVQSYVDFGKQLLELAAENAEMILLVDEENDIIEEASINKQSILDTINQVE